MITKNIDVNGVTTTLQKVYPEWVENKDEQDNLVSITARVFHCLNQDELDLGKSRGDCLVTITDLTGYDNTFSWVENAVDGLI